MKEIKTTEKEGIRLLARIMRSYIENGELSEKENDILEELEDFGRLTIKKNVGQMSEEGEAC